MSSTQLARLLPAALSFPVAVVSLRMAWKSFSARAWLPFHSAAAGSSWEALSPRLRALLLFLVRMVGLGFLAQFLLLATVPISVAWETDPFLTLTVFGVGTTYCIGLGVLTRQLHLETGAATPWKGSFAAAGVLALAAVLTVVAG